MLRPECVGWQEWHVESTWLIRRPSLHDLVNRFRRCDSHNNVIAHICSTQIPRTTAAWCAYASCA